MKIVLLEPLGVSDELLAELAGPLRKAGHSFTAYDSFSTDEAELICRADQAEVLMLANHPLSGAVIESQKALRFLSVAFVGIDHVDEAACRRQGITISNTGGYCTDAVAELTLGLTLSCLRKIPACHAAVQAGEGKGQLAGRELSGRTVGIVGTGAIGCRAAALFKAFGCRVLGFSRSGKAQDPGIGIEMVPLEELLERSDIVSVHTPLTAESRGLVGEKELALLKEGAVLINTARGPVVDSRALGKALREGRLFAGIDVYEKDPPLAADHPLMGAPNLVCTPHVGFDTKESIERRAFMAFENVQAFLSGKPVRVVSKG